MNIAIIPARGGSKRIPKKNVKDFLGKPIIEWPILCALKSNLFERVIVSTDDHEIAEISRNAGAEVPFIRPGNISNDSATTISVIKHCIQYFINQEINLNYVCCIYPTAPLIQTEDLINGYRVLACNQAADFSFAAVKYEYPIERYFKLDPQGNIQFGKLDFLNKNSQEFSDSFHDAGQFYWGKSKVWLEKKAILGANSIPIVLPSYRAQDIDTEDDWVMAELKFRNLKGGARC